jgi:hypothetical protein
MHIMRSIALILLLSVALYSCETANNQHPSAGYEQKKASLQDMEHDSPLKFLKVTGTKRGNLLNQTVVEGEIVNHATMISYHNIKLVMVFKDENGAVIEKDNETIDNVVKPGATNDFKVKLDHVKGAENVEVDITAADPTTN